MHVIPIFSITTLIFAGLASCSDPSARKLDEVVFYDGPHFKLKLVRYYENLPFSFVGEVFRVQALSAFTAHIPGHRTQDPGWKTLGMGGATGSNNAQEILDRERHKYLIINDETLVWVDNGFNISFESLRSSRSWSPTSLSDEFITRAGKSLNANQTFRFENIEVSQKGLISFTVHSKEFKNQDALKIRSADFGKTWSVKSTAAKSSDATWEIIERKSKSPQAK